MTNKEVLTIDKLCEVEDKLGFIKEMSESINNELVDEEENRKLDLFTQQKIKHIRNYNDILNDYYFIVDNTIRELKEIVKSEIINNN